MSTSTQDPAAQSTPHGPIQRPAFVTTHWSVVLSAGKTDTTQATSALEKLCQTYWKPIYAFVHRQGHNPHDAQDLTQEFFARLLEKKWLGDANPERGKFRSFLLAAVKHFLANEWNKVRAQKRGGGKLPLPMNFRSAETSFEYEPADHLTAEKIYERRWALTLLDVVLGHLREEYVSDEKEKLFEELKSTLTAGSKSAPYAELGERLDLSEGGVKVAVHRLRQRYRELLRAEIAETVADPGEVDEEIRNLFAALA